MIAFAFALGIAAGIASALGRRRGASVELPHHVRVKAVVAGIQPLVSVYYVDEDGIDEYCFGLTPDHACALAGALTGTAVAARRAARRRG